MYEATVAEMDDGRCLMVMRMSNHGGKVKGCKMCSVSADQCRTWSAPKPLTYDDESWLYSSASNGILLRHSSGRVFYCGVITQTNTRSNSPRWPVCLAEVDQQSLTICKASVRVVATRRPDEPSSVQYVNHGIYEDKDTGSLVVLTPRLLPKLMRKTSIEKHVAPIALFDPPAGG